MPLAGLAISAELLHDAELVVVDLLQFNFDYFLLIIEMIIGGRGKVLLLDNLGLVALIDDEALGLESLCYGLEVVFHGEHCLV